MTTSNMYLYEIKHAYTSHHHQGREYIIMLISRIKLYENWTQLILEGI